MHFIILLYDKCRFTSRLGSTYSGVVSRVAINNRRTSDNNHYIRLWFGGIRVYCHICGTKNNSGEATCQKCGTRLKQFSSTEEQIWSEPAGLEPRNGSASGTVSKPKSSGPFLWIIPLLLAAIMGALLTYYYNQESLIMLM